MSNNTPPLLSLAVEQRLLEARRAACDEMHRLIDERGHGEFTAAATSQFFHLTRRVASIDAARHDGDFSALTGDEIAWLQSQGVQIENRIKSDLARLDRMMDEDIDYSDIPPLDDEFFKKAKCDMAPGKARAARSAAQSRRDLSVMDKTIRKFTSFDEMKADE